jgi:hypothetical protein
MRNSAGTVRYGMNVNVNNLTKKFLWLYQCCGSGMFYPESGSDQCSIPDPDPGSGG